MLAFFGVISGLLLTGGLGFPLTIIIIIAFAAGIGLYHGVLISKLGLAPFIATLGSLSVFRGLAVIITQGYPIPIKNEAFLFLGQGLIFGVPVPFILLVIIALFLNYFLNRTATGRHIYAIGGNLEAAKLSGIPIDRVLIVVYSMAMVLFSLGAMVMGSRLGQGMPGIGIGYELKAIAAAVIGGTSLYGGIGTVLGTIIGATLMALIDNLLVLARVEPWWNEVVIGVVIVLAVTIDMISTKRRMRDLV
jgi:ribose transport system permease protein